MQGPAGGEAEHACAPCHATPAQPFLAGDAGVILRTLRRWRLRPAFRALREADAARDAGRWAQAAQRYRRYLQDRPLDAPVWVQLGHAEKEGGEHARAEAAYREAMRLRADDHDAPLHLGHVLKLQGRLVEATEAYDLSARLAPVNHAAQELRALRPEPEADAPRGLFRPAPIARVAEREALVAAQRAAHAAPEDREARRALAEAALAAHEHLLAREAALACWAAQPDRRHWQLARRTTGAPPPPAGTAAPGATLYDVTDLLSLVRQTGRATGIQRVQLGLAEGILADPAAAAEARFVVLAERMGPLWTLEVADLRAILTYCLSERHDPDRARALVDAAHDRARPTDLTAARHFVILGAFWFWTGAPAALARLRAAGIRIGVLVYDLIPATHPEYTSEGTVLAFRQGLAEGAQLWDFALTISEYTARELRRALDELGAPAIPIRPVPLAHRMNATMPEGSAAWPPALEGLRGQDYILSVSTIEARKNHLALFQAWRLLLAEGFEPPPLVIVGRPGWRVDDLMAQLEATRYLDGRIRIVHGISDPELDALYRGCLFSIFPSFTEGWGLPVGESLALGKLCLASPEGATPEAGGGFAEPIDAYSPRAIAARVRHFITDRAALAAAEARIREGFRARSWAEVSADFLAALAELTAAPPPQRETPMPPHLAPGERWVLSPGAPACMLLGAGFEPPEKGGAPLLGAHGSLEVTLEAPATLLLRLAARPWAEMNRLGAFAEGAQPRWFGLMPGQEAAAVLDLPAGTHQVGLVLDGPLEPPPGHPDPRPIRLALREVAAVAPGAARLPPRRGIQLGPLAENPAWAAMLAEGWDLSPDMVGVQPISVAPVIAFAAEGVEAGEGLRVLLHLAVQPGAGGVLRHAEGELPLPQGGGPLILPQRVEAGEGGLVRLRLSMAEGGVPPLRLVGLQWAAENDTEGRLALLEGLLMTGGEGLGLSGAERIAQIEARLQRGAGAAPLPGGEAGRAALRLAGARRS